MQLNDVIGRAAEWISDADGLLVTAGAGMGVDSGLPDFRGTEGFWRAYPALQAAGIRFEEIASPETFLRDPALAWGFYGHRLDLYRRTQPHRGFGMLRSWAAKMRQGAFVFTSNVDGQFQKAGFPENRIAECHGSIHWLQCVNGCSPQLWSADAVSPAVDERSGLLVSPVPRCPSCAAVARPNILMFNDSQWIERRADRQLRELERWMSTCRNPVVVELGAGRAIPTVRRFGERCGAHLIRINPREFEIESPHGIGIAGTALSSLGKIDALMKDSRE
jgi:NAD-dependent SIR2 family protein deacetylase